MRPRALLICLDPLPLTGGDSIYTYGIALRLGALYELDVLALSRNAGNGSGALRASLESACRNYRAVLPGPGEERSGYRFLHNWSSRVYSGALVDAVARTLAEGRYDAVFIDHLRLSYVLPVVRGAAPGIPIAAIHHNIEYDNFREELGSEPRWSRRLMLRIKNVRLRATERSFVTRSDVNFFISEEDRRTGVLRAGRDDGRARVLPAYFPFQRTKPEDELRRECVCFMLLGNLSWFPNYHGAAWFVNEAFPELRKRLPGCRVLVVGRPDDRPLAPFRIEGVELRGFSSDTEAVFREADLLLVPNELGGGSKMKILEALGRGLPVVAHTRSTHGFPPELFEGGFCAGTRAEFVERVLAVAQDSPARTRFVRRGLAYVGERARLHPSLVSGLGHPAAPRG